MKLFVLLVLFSVSSLVLKAQSPLENYVQMGLESNLLLQQKKVDYEIAFNALKEARGLFFPEVSINARYTLASGGRVIEFPVGDLMNPVYQSLNQLMQLPENQQFPLLENEEIPFLRGKEHDTKVSLVQPIYNAKLNANLRLKKEQLSLSNSQVRQYMNELTYEIKKAYFDCLKTIEVAEVIRESQQLLIENLRVNQKLVENKMATKDVVLRAKTELSSIEMKYNEAVKNSKLAQSYFNFLINREFDADIQIDPTLTLVSTPDENELKALALEHREEIKQIDIGSNVYTQLAKISSAENIPSLFLAADYGFQGEEYQFNNNQDYAMVTVGLKWTLFNGATNKHKKNQALLQKQQLAVKKQETKRLIELQLRDVVFDYQQKIKDLAVAKRQLVEANEGYRMTFKKYKNGTATHLELLDAQNTCTQAEMKVIVTNYDRLNDLANLEKITSTSFH